LAAKLDIKIKKHAMKRFKFISAVITVVLMVGTVSCTTTRGAEDDYYYDRAPQASNRIYVDDPYRGTVVLERDPFSGRYYEVGQYGGYAPRYSNRNSRYGSVYNRNYSRNRVYNNNGNYNRPRTNNSNSNQGQTEQQKKDWEKSREEARKKVLGN
jgi:hypothetical protein